MSTQNPFLGKLEATSDPRQVALVQTIIDKTKAKKLYWDRQPGGYTAAVPTSNKGILMKIDFKGTGNNWQSFTVWTANEGFVLKTEFQPISEVLSRLAGVAANELDAKVSELFSIVSQVGEGSVDRAKKILEQL